MYFYFFQMFTTEVFSYLYPADTSYAVVVIVNKPFGSNILAQKQIMDFYLLNVYRKNPIQST